MEARVFAKVGLPVRHGTAGYLGDIALIGRRKASKPRSGTFTSEVIGKCAQGAASTRGDAAAYLGGAAKAVSYADL